MNNNTPSKTVLITGASSGLGKQMAIEFAQRGYNLVLSARRLDALQALKQQLQNHPVIIECWQCDVCDEGALKAMLQQAADTFSSIDIIIANAGMGGAGFVGNSDFSVSKATIDLNVTAAMATAHYGIEIFRRQGFGQMVFIGSVAGYRGLPGSSAYSVSKAAIRSFAESLRVETYREDITVTVLNPGYIDTPINQNASYRPFVIEVEKGGKILVDLIEAKVKRAMVPSWPWGLIARVLAILPTAIVAKAMG